jgi:transporter family protein
MNPCCSAKSHPDWGGFLLVSLSQSAGENIGKLIPSDREGDHNMWFTLALASSVFAALTSILAKIGIDGVNSNLATAIRTFVVLIMSWGMVLLTNTQHGLGDISKKSWIFLILSGLATGASWLCYYRALQLGEASKVVPIDKLSIVITMVLAAAILQETFTPKSMAGCVLITAGTLLMVL